jgi:hypothetical protein
MPRIDSLHTFPPCSQLPPAAPLQVKSGRALDLHFVNRNTMSIGATFQGARVISVRVNRHAMAMQFAQILADDKARDVHVPHDSHAKHATFFLT